VSVSVYRAKGLDSLVDAGAFFSQFLDNPINV
jgi:hypothetical protein